MIVMVTVGTTRFDSLIHKVCSKEFQELAIEKGYTRLVIQHGYSVCEPAKTELGIEMFQFTHDFKRRLQESDLIISHGGSGTILEALYLRKPLIAVVNTALMDNHQKELVNQLERCLNIKTVQSLDLDLKETIVLDKPTVSLQPLIDQLMQNN